MDLDANLADMDMAQLLEQQQALTRQRLEVLDAQRRVQAELDRRQVELAERRAAEDRMLGAATKPPAQDLFGGSPPELVAGDDADAFDFVEANEMADMLADDLADERGS